MNGGIGGDIRDFVFLRGSIPADATYTVAGVGRYEFPLAALAIIDGGPVSYTHLLSSFDIVTTLILSRLASFLPFFEVIPEIFSIFVGAGAER